MVKRGPKPKRPEHHKLVEDVPPEVLLRPKGPLYDDQDRYNLVLRLLDLSLKSLVEKFEQSPGDMSAAERGEAAKLISTWERYFGSDVKAAMAQKKAQQSMMSDIPTFDGADEDDPLLNKEAYQAPFNGESDKKDSEDEK